MTGNKFHKDKMFAKISHTASSGVVGDAEYEVLGEIKISVATTFATSGTLTVQGRIKHSSSWQTVGTLTSGGDFDTFDIDAYDFIRFNFTVAAGSTGEIAASGFFKAAAGGGAAFSTIQTDAGTSPVAVAADTLTLTSSDSSVTITGNSTTDTVDFVVADKGDAFTTFACDSGTNPVADSATDTITFTSSDASISITGNSTTDTIDLVAAGGGGSGDVVGPASATDNAIARFDATTGKLIQNSGVVIDDSARISAEYGGYSQSEVFGLLSSVSAIAGHAFGYAAAAGNRAVAVGRSASASQDSVTVGYLSSDSGNTKAAGLGYGASPRAQGAVALGYSAVADGTNSTAVGRSANAATTSSFALGYLAMATTSTGNMAVGSQATSTGTDSIAFGRSSTASGSYSLTMGYSNTSSHNNSIVFGNNYSSFAANQIIFGSVYDVWVGRGQTSATATAYPARFHTTGGSGTDIAGAEMSFRSGISTGSAEGGSMTFYTTPAGTTGSSANTSTKHMEIRGNGEIIMNAENAATADGDLWNNSISFYLDETGNTLTVKAKYSSGTVKTGTIALT
jgi:hypothetical protein